MQYKFLPKNLSQCGVTVNNRGSSTYWHKYVESAILSVGPVPTGTSTQKVPYYLWVQYLLTQVRRKCHIICDCFLSDPHNETEHVYFLHFQQAKYAPGSVLCRFFRLAGYRAGLGEKCAPMRINVACDRPYVQNWPWITETNFFECSTKKKKISKNLNYGVCRKSFRWETHCFWMDTCDGTNSRFSQPFCEERLKMEHAFYVQ